MKKKFSIALALMLAFCMALGAAALAAPSSSSGSYEGSSSSSSSTGGTNAAAGQVLGAYTGADGLAVATSGAGAVNTGSTPDELNAIKAAEGITGLTDANGKALTVLAVADTGIIAQAVSEAVALGGLPADVAALVTAAVQGGTTPPAGTVVKAVEIPAGTGPTVTMTVPGIGALGKVLVLHQYTNADGTKGIETLAASVNGDRVTFTSDRGWSPVIIVGASEAASAPGFARLSLTSPKTGQQAAAGIILAAACLGAAAVFGRLALKKR